MANGTAFELEQKASNVAAAEALIAGSITGKPRFFGKRHCDVTITDSSRQGVTDRTWRTVLTKAGRPFGSAQPIVVANAGSTYDWLVAAPPPEIDGRTATIVPPAGLPLPSPRRHQLVTLTVLDRLITVFK